MSAGETGGCAAAAAAAATAAAAAPDAATAGIATAGPEAWEGGERPGFSSPIFQGQGKDGREKEGRTPPPTPQTPPKIGRGSLTLVQSSQPQSSNLTQQ